MAGLPPEGYACGWALVGVEREEAVGRGGGDLVLASCRRGPSDHCPLCVRVPPSAVYIVYIKDEES